MKSSIQKFISRFFFAALFSLIAVCAASAQEPVKPQPTVDPCPRLMAASTDESIIGEPIVFTALLSDGDPRVTPTFEWSLSAGKISGGKGSSSITVDTAGIKVGETITATVEVGGYNRSCEASKSSSTLIIRKP